MPALLFRHLDDLPDAFYGGVVSIGNFDGVHRGHARIVERLLALARPRGVPTVVLTFDPHPARLLCPERAPMPLSRIEYRARLLGELGVDAIVSYPTDEALLNLSAADFFRRIVLDQLGARGMVEGRNFFFGRKRDGDIGVLDHFCRESGIPLEIVEPAELDGQVVSSSRVRGLIAAGQVAAAARLLARPYRIRGAVVHGQGRGNRLGYPTANVGGIDTLLPGEGIYAGRAWIAEKPYAAAISLGSNPTFGDAEIKLEAFLLDYEGDLYGQPMEIDFLSRLRDIKQFASADQLVEQIARDVQETRKVAGGE